MSASLRTFPWHQVPALHSADLDLERAAKRALESHVDLTLLPLVSNQLFLMEFSGAGVQRSRITSERKQLGCQLMFRSRDLIIFLSLEPPLVAHLVRRVLGQPPRVDSNSALGLATTGAALAILSEVARRISRGVPLAPDFSVSPDGKPTPLAVGAQRAWGVDFWIRLDGVSYAGFAAVTPDRGPSAPEKPEDALLAGVQAQSPISLPLVIARCVLDAADYQTLCVGDVVLPEEPNNLTWTTTSVATGVIADGVHTWLCSPGASRALALSSRNGKLCLAGTTHLSYDAAVTSKQAPGQDGKQPSADVSAADVIMDAPVVVHLELGSVSLSAQSWLGLRVGDVVCSELPVGKPVTLRVAERAVAEGELVTVDGHVGVRVQRFFKG